MARKRKLDAEKDPCAPKRPKLDQNKTLANHVASHPVLKCFYPEVYTLRDFILSRVQNPSRRRERLLRQREPTSHHDDSSAKLDLRETYRLLDKVLVGIDAAALPRRSSDNILEDFQKFTQQLTASTTESLFGQANVSYSEIVDFVIWLLFSRIYRNVQKPPHILCHGISRASTTFQNVPPAELACTIPGLVPTYPNEHAETLKGKPWGNLHNLLGKHGDHIMVDLFARCGLFLPIEGPDGSVYQLSGVPLSEMTALEPKAILTERENVVLSEAASAPSKAPSILRKPSDIRFVRYRMLYARGALNAKGDVALGLRHIHVFRRFPDANKQEHTVRIMKYLFPRQFVMHNVFTSKTDTRETSQPFKDYTLREEEISRLDYVKAHTKSPGSKPQSIDRIPKRLRDRCFHLVVKLQKRHNRCSYTELLQYYCPFPSNLARSHHQSKKGTETQQRLPLTDFASAPSQVSAFCRAVISRVFPSELFGDSDVIEHNRRVLLRKVDEFLFAKRFETLTLESAMTGMKIGGVDWLRPSKQSTNTKMSLSDFSKRKEIFAELIYYVFDSFLIPLIRSNFHVTESSTDKNRLFYFRHDVWKLITEPAIGHLKSSMLEEMGNANALQVLNKRTLGFSQIRLLPKGSTLRPISNLRRRAKVIKDGRTWLGKSINSVLAPAFSVLKYEKQLQSEKLGASLFSVTEMFPKLCAFRSKLCERGLARTPLYFVKVDVKACFDSLPQAELSRLAQSLPSCSEYSVSTHIEIRPPETDRRVSSRATLTKPKKTFRRTAVAGWPRSFVQAAHEYAQTRHPNTVFVDAVIPQFLDREQANELQSQHIGAHIVRIGKKYYRQKQGIPQGSVLSTLLCNFFFGDFEAKHLGFLSVDGCVLFRLIDDFLLVSTRKDLAEHFLKVMHAGSPAYGITIKPEKSLVNFEMQIDGRRVPRLDDAAGFPYCGLLIDTKTLDVSKDGITNKNTKDALTVEYSHQPGSTFRRKMLNGLKMQMRAMLLDTSHNSFSTVLANIYNIFAETARKCFEYAECLAKERAPLNPQLVQDISALAFALAKSNRKKLQHSQYKCELSKQMVQWLAATAFLNVFEKKSAKYTVLIDWLRSETSRFRVGSLAERELLMNVVVKKARQ